MDLDIVMNDRHANSSLHKYVYLVMFTVQMSLCWAKPQSSKFLRGGVKEGSVDTAWFGLMGQNHLPVPTIKLSFTPFRTKPVWILYKPTLLSHIIFDIV